MTVAPDLSLPQPDLAIVSAVHWMEQVLSGPVAVSVATIGIAFFGFLMLQGRMDWRRGLAVCSGCFLLFGARSIAGNLVGLAGNITPEASSSSVRLPVDLPVPPPPPAFDPYSGASTLQSQQ